MAHDDGKGGYDLDGTLDRDDANLEASGLELAEAPQPPPPKPSLRPASAPPPPTPPLASMRPRPPVAPPTPASTASGPRVLILAAVVAIVAVAGLWMALHRTTVPDLVVNDAEKQPLHLADMRQGHARLLFVFLAPGAYGDATTAFALNTIKAESARRPELFAVAGLVLGMQADADAMRTKMEVPFPVYSLKDAPDPFIVRDFVNAAGMDARRVISGSTALIDDQQRVMFSLTGEDIRKLPEKLAALKE